MSEVYLQNFHNLTIKLATDNVNELIVDLKPIASKILTKLINSIHFCHY